MGNAARRIAAGECGGDWVSLVLTSRFIRYVAFAFGMCAAFGVYYRQYHSDFIIMHALFGMLIGIAITTLVTVRLPVFRDYFQRDPINTGLDRTETQTGGNMRAALFLCSAFGASVAAAIAYLLALSPVLVPVTCAAISAAVLGLYYDRKCSL